MQIAHGACPEKRDIVAPTFVKRGDLVAGQTETWQCVACGTVIYVLRDEKATL